VTTEVNTEVATEVDGDFTAVRPKVKSAGAKAMADPAADGDAADELVTKAKLLATVH
jgi:hypothetical protein